MKKEGYYSSGEFAKMAHITKKTIRYYDEHNILKPSFLTEHGARFYTDDDFARLQQILLLKYLGFALDDIREMTINDSDTHFMNDSLKLQLKLVQDRIEQLQIVENAIKDTIKAIDAHETIDWTKMLTLIPLTGMEKSLKNQYQNASNITSRINLHSVYSVNQQGWFPWAFEQCHLTSGMKILELGCGNGSLWLHHLAQLPDNLEITLTDVSEGMLRDARRAISTDIDLELKKKLFEKNIHFNYKVVDAQKITFDAESFDLIIANHVLFYCEDLDVACKEIYRVLRPNGIFLCSTYGTNHMKEISQLVSDFDDRIVLSAQKLYDRFGKENGESILSKYFSSIQWLAYDDHLNVTEPEPLISYVLSCHGNQNQYITDRFKDFRNFVKKKTDKGFYITKDAGLFQVKK